MAYYAYKTVRDSVPHDFMEKYRDDSSDPCDYDGWMWYGAAGYIELLGKIRTAAIAYKAATDAREAFRQADDPTEFARLMTVESNAYAALVAALAHHDESIKPTPKEPAT